jgi:hypothetical protein
VKILWHGGEQESLFRVILYIRYRESTRRAVIPDGCHLESILIEVIPDIFYRESIFGLISDGSPPTTCGDDRSELSFPLAFGGNPGCLSTDGSPPVTCGDDD